MDLNNVDEQIEFYDEDYWERGTASGKSNYNNWGICEPWDDEFIAAFDKVIPIKDKRILDIGCAFGGIVLACLKKGSVAFGIDISHYAVISGHEKYQALCHATTFGSAHELPYGDEYFDIVHSNQVFEHIPSALVPQMLSEMWRVMKPGAIAWVGTVFNEEKGNPDHITVKPFEWWREHVEAAGFVIDMSIDDAFRATGLQFFDQCQWHSFSFRKPA